MMGYAGDDDSIIKSNPSGWTIVFVGMIAAGIAIILLIAFFTGPDAHPPAWAPPGCTVVYNRGHYNSIMVLVQDLEYFDTEEELAAVIITALEQEGRFFDDRVRYYTPVEREVDIQFPRTRDYRTPILQYMGGRMPTGERIPAVDQHWIRVVGAVDDDERYFIRGIPYSDLLAVARGEKELGFLDWMGEAYGREERE